MVAANRPKPVDKQEICRKVSGLLKKAYSGVSPRRELPVLETLLYAVCLENIPPPAAEAVYARLLNAFHDLNEVRVSSITELQPVFADVSEPDWRALRIKSSLQFVFETNYAFEFESLKRKTADLAAKHLAKIPSLSPFVRAYVMQHCLGSHVLPISSTMHAALIWLGLAEPGTTAEEAAEALRPFVRKADSVLFCHWIHCLATDPKRMRAFTAANSKPPDVGSDPIARLDQLLRRGDTGAGRGKVTKSKSHKASRKPAAKNGRHPSRASRTRVGTKKRH